MILSASSTARDAVVGVTAVAVAALLRVVWQLANRVARIEGRLNGREEK